MRHGAGRRSMDKISPSRHTRGVTLPHVRPIIPTWRKEPFDDPDWLFEFKYDGFRGPAILSRAVAALSRATATS